MRSRHGIVPVAGQKATEAVVLMPADRLGQGGAIHHPAGEKKRDNGLHVSFQLLYVQSVLHTPVRPREIHRTVRRFLPKSNHYSSYPRFGILRIGVNLRMGPSVGVGPGIRHRSVYVLKTGITPTSNVHKYPSYRQVRRKNYPNRKPPASPTLPRFLK